MEGGEDIDEDEELNTFQSDEEQEEFETNVEDNSHDNLEELNKRVEGLVQALSKADDIMNSKIASSKATLLGKK